MSDMVEMRVERVVQEAAHLRHVTLGAQAPFTFGYGQYVKVTNGTEKPGFFAIASPPEAAQTIEFLVKDGTGMARVLYDARPGDRLLVSPPLGPGFPRGDLLGRNVVLIGVGSGLAPLRSVLMSILAERSAYGERVMLVYGARTPFHIPFRAEIARWRAQVEVYKAMSQPADADWSGYVGYVQHLLEDIDIPRQNTIACLCGMPAMVEAVKGVLHRMGLPEDDICLNF